MIQPRSHTVRKVRPARPGELYQVYLLGYDAWGAAGSVEEYVAGCEISPKYAAGRWYVLEAGGRIASALICYRGVFGLPEGAFGLGSVATAPDLRKLGHARALIEEVLRVEPGPAFLHSDIAPGFYRRLGFLELPAGMQRKAGSTLMVRGAPPKGLDPPSYF